MLVPILQPYLLALFVPLIAVLVHRFPLHYLLLLDLLLVALPGQWHVGGVRFDPSDLILLTILGRLASQGRQGELLRQVPLRRGWLVLVILVSISYLAAPVNQEWLTDPVRISYQLYRYAWRPLLFYPLAWMLLSDDVSMRHFRLSVVASGAIISVQAAVEGYAGFRANGPFIGENALGAALIIPLIMSWAGVLEGRSWRWFCTHLGGVALCLRGLLFSGSRGAFAASTVGLLCVTWWLRSDPEIRLRIRRVLLMSPLMLLLLFVVKPDLFERPTVQRMLSLSEGTEASTMAWRINYRWPHFLARALERPMLGHWTHVDPTLSQRANTPHNGYLATAVSTGFPSLFVLLGFVIAGIYRGLSLRRLGGIGRPWQCLGAVCAAGLAALLVHNIVDSVFKLEFPVKLMWCLMGITLGFGRPAPSSPPASTEDLG